MNFTHSTAHNRFQRPRKSSQIPLSWITAEMLSLLTIYSLNVIFVNYLLFPHTYNRDKSTGTHTSLSKGTHCSLFWSHLFSITLITVDFCQLQVVLGWHLRNNSAGGWEKYVGMIHQNKLTPWSLLYFCDTASFPFSVRGCSNSLKCLLLSPS